MKKYRSIICGVVIFALLFIWFVYINNDYIQYCFNGMNYQYYSNDYYLSQNIYQSTIDFYIDLNNMENEIGKKISIDESCYLEITNLRLLDNGQYDIIIQSHGVVNYNQSILYTANDYYQNGIDTNTTFSTDDVIWYQSFKASIQNKDGDYFGYSIDKDKIIHKLCKVTVTNLNRLELNRK